MNVIAYTALKYGREYLGYAIRSVIDYVDAYHVLYALTPSHGHSTDIPCPESEDELYALAAQAAGNKLHWHRGTWAHEGLQRDSIAQYAPDADAIIVLDSDEIWNGGVEHFVQTYLPNCLNNKNASKRNVRFPIVHYWRSFYRCILHDPAFPVRLIIPSLPDGETYWPQHMGVINHMGYAQRPEIVAYKWRIHGHFNELRKDVDWFKDVYLTNRQTDCHPVGSEWWNPEAVHPLDYMPAFMAEHPYYRRALIE